MRKSKEETARLRQRAWELFELGKSQQNIAREIGVSQPTVSKYLRGDSKVHIAIAPDNDGAEWDERAFDETCDKVSVTTPPLEPSRTQLEIFVQAIFRHASPQGVVSVRSFYEKRDRLFRITSVALSGGLKFLVDVAEDDARRAAQFPEPIVFCPPLAIFSSGGRAREQDISEGVALSVECDEHPQQARATLEALLGPATVVVKSGGLWVNGNAEAEDRLHLHWRLARPAKGEGDLAKLKLGRDLAARRVGGDPSNKSVVHPIRWPGSWHRKAEPRPCRIAVLNADHEIDLDVALAALVKASPEAIAPVAHGAGKSGQEDWSELIANIISGKNYHPSLVPLSARLVGSGCHDGTAVKMLRALMKASTAEHDTQRWQARYDAIPEIVRSAREKFAAEKKETTARGWDDPDWSILDTRRGDLPEFPLHEFSKEIQETIKRTAKGAGVTTAHVAVPLLGIVSSLIGIARRVKATSSWLQCTTCWTVLVGFSGTGKTPAINVTKRALNLLERNSEAADDERRRKHETKQEIASATRKSWEKNVKEAIEARTPAPPMPAGADDPGRFIPVKLWVADGTIERLADLLSARPQGVLVLRDELSALFTNMSRYSNGQDNEFWLEAWNGDAFSQERMSRTLHVDHLLIGIAGGMQPDKLAKSFEGDHDGMYARVLFAWPPEPQYSPLSDEAQEIDTDILNIVTRINKLAEFTAEGELVAKVIPLSGEARDDFVQFLQFVHRGKEAFEGREREWFAKMTAHVLRLAGTLTFLEWALDIEAAKPESVGKAQMATAISLVRDYFWPHARACLRQIGLTQRHADARRVLRWLQANPNNNEIGVKDIRRDALSQTLDATHTEQLLDGLAVAGWLRRKPVELTGGRPVHRWLVNPELFSNPDAESAGSAERG